MKTALCSALLDSWTSTTQSTNKAKTSPAWHNTSLSDYLLQRAAYHPIYERIANGTLNPNNFLGFIQQDDLYVTNLFESVQILHDRVPESDTYTRSELANVLSDREFFRNFFNGVYDNSKDGVSTPRQADPVTLGYMAFERTSAAYEDIGVALISFFPCFTVYYQMGILIDSIADLKHNPDHKYRSFIEAVLGFEGSELNKYEALVTHHYNHPSAAATEGEALVVRKKMLETYLQGLDWEWKFAESCLTTVAETKSSPILSFTDLIESKVVVHLQHQMIEHDFWKQLAEGSLSIGNFEALIRQDLIYLSGFYDAFKWMENTEVDPDKKVKLRKNGAEEIAFFKKLVSVYGFELDAAVEPYALKFVNFLTCSANRSVHEGLAAIYPSYYLWNEVAKRPIVMKAVRSSTHPYKEFITATLSSDGVGMAKTRRLVNGYYESLENDWIEKDRMFRAAEEGIHNEFLFIDGTMNG